MKNRYDCKF